MSTHSAGVPYEYAVAEAKTPKRTLRKVGLIAFYFVFVVGIALLAMQFPYIIPLFALTPLILWILWFLTWRYTRIEYEYSFFAGAIRIVRVLNNRHRKTLLELPIKSLVAVFPYREEAYARADAFAPQRLIMAASSMDAEHLYALLAEDEDGKKLLAWVELDDRAVKLIKYHNIACMSKS